MTCNRPPAFQLVLGAIGVLPVSSAVVVSSAPSAMPALAPAPLVLRPSVPDAPPPRVL